MLKLGITDCFYSFFYSFFCIDFSIGKLQFLLALVTGLSFIYGMGAALSEYTSHCPQLHPLVTQSSDAQPKIIKSHIVTFPFHNGRTASQKYLASNQISQW